MRLAQGSIKEEGIGKSGRSLPARGDNTILDMWRSVPDSSKRPIHMAKLGLVQQKARLPRHKIDELGAIFQNTTTVVNIGVASYIGFQ